MTRAFGTFVGHPTTPIPQNKIGGTLTSIRAVRRRVGPNNRSNVLEYVVGSSTTITAHPHDATPHTRSHSGRGRPSQPAYPEAPRSVKELVIAVGKREARPVQWREGSRPGSGRSGFKGMYWRLVALRIRPAGREIRKAVEGAELPACWLPAEWPATEWEPVQFWLSNLPDDTPLTTLVRLAKLRWRIEYDYREMRQALGLAHIEAAPGTAGTTTSPSSPPPAPSAPSNAWPGP